MHEEIAKAYEETGRSMGRELAACDRVRDFMHEVTQPWQGRPLEPDPGHDVLIATLYARSFNTFWAALELVRMGFGHQAAMLNRSLFEDMVDAHWIASNPELALERMRAHHEHGRMLFADALAKHPTFYDAADIPGFDEEERERLDAMFGKYGAKSWTTLNLHDRVGAIEGHWQGDAVKTLRFFLDIVHRENNQTLHVSARGLTDTVRAHDETGLTLKLGPGGEMLDRSLYGAFWLFAQTAGLIFDHFEFPVDDETRSEVFSDTDFARLEPEDLRDVGRNDLCPCGSGKKFKRCHGA